MNFKSNTAEICDKIIKHRDFKTKATTQLKEFISTTNKQVLICHNAINEVEEAQKQLHLLKTEQVSGSTKLNEFTEAVRLLAVVCGIDVSNND